MEEVMNEIFGELLQAIIQTDQTLSFSFEGANFVGHGGDNPNTRRMILDAYSLFRTEMSDFAIEIHPEKEWRQMRSSFTHGVYDYNRDIVGIRDREFLDVVSVGFHEVAEREMLRGRQAVLCRHFKEAMPAPGESLSPNVMWLSHALALVAQIFLTEKIERCSDIGGKMRNATLNVLHGVDLGGLFFVQDYRQSRGADFDRLLEKYVRFNATWRQRSDGDMPPPHSPSCFTGTLHRHS